MVHGLNMQGHVEFNLTKVCFMRHAANRSELKSVTEPKEQRPTAIFGRWENDGKLKGHGKWLGVFRCTSHFRFILGVFRFMVRSWFMVGCV